MTAHTDNPDPEQRHAGDPYAPFYDDDAADSCSVCDKPIADEPVECADWPGRWHHDECARDCVECKGALQSERHRW